MDTFNLNRFIDAQADCYGHVVSELSAGSKQSHWMWFVFPQIDGLGFSEIAIEYAIKSAEEALEYISHPVLGTRYCECLSLILMHEGISANDILGYPDDLKFQSSLTLFLEVAPENTLIQQALDLFFSGAKDVNTIEILRSLSSTNWLD